MPISGIRLSDWFHRMAHDGAVSGSAILALASTGVYAEDIIHRGQVVKIL
jgi:hypothetical protein